MTTIDLRARRAVRTSGASYKPGTPIEEVQRKLKLKSVIKLASNENALGPSPRAIAALRRATSSLHRYPDATCRALREQAAKHLRVAPDSLIFGNGSDELIVMALRAFVDPGEEVVVASPTFLIYELQAKVAGASVRVVPLRDYRYDLVAMKAAVTPSTKLVFIANPDNPTGTYVTKTELEEFLRGLPSQTIVFMDEAYYEFVEAKDYPQTLRYVADRSMIVTRSFSKAYGLAGLRVGYGIAQPSLIAAMDAVREPFNVNSLAQAAAAAALGDHAFLARTRRVNAQGRRMLTAALDELRLRYVPSVTNFLLIELGPRAALLAQALLRHGVIVREMSAWKLSGCIRVTIGTPAENRRFLTALKVCLRNGGGS
ncbi:MAG: histidinol-phosphate transaminase [Candidatus Omnitrophica bacterium CG11_big_fil_rev_8_21_14_0_20_63_9]|nr:MAG: histidinol-phosphate transaminase [Candidatus Omnitrophica bacterium CG11_big_fil_rev_8_21_14_0_20_63_9]